MFKKHFMNKAAQTKSITHEKAAKMSGDIVIPACMNEIRDSLFDGNKNITSVDIPGTVQRIGSRAFASCENLESVILHEGIEEIDTNVFTDCHKLRKVIYPDSVTGYKGWTFYRTSLAEPVLNASGTVLVFCPTSSAGREWSVPDTVKVIAMQAFIELEDLETVHLPEGLEEIRQLAFIQCGIREVLIPSTVKEICKNAFWRCEKLKRITLRNPDVKIGYGAFDSNDVEIRCEGLWESDKIFHMKGQPFLTQQMDEAANLHHQSEVEFLSLTALCAKGNAHAMNALADWFASYAENPAASRFYLRAANYWRYRAYCNGDPKAAKWMEAYFAEHPHEHLESLLYESSDHQCEYYSHNISGRLLNDLGYSFFDPERDYEIKLFEDEDVVQVSAYESYYGPDEDGFGAETYYDFWFLDKNLQPIPGVERVNSTLRETQYRHFQDELAKAKAYLKQRKNEEI